MRFIFMTDLANVKLRNVIIKNNLDSINNSCFN